MPVARSTWPDVMCTPTCEARSCCDYVFFHGDERVSLHCVRGSVSEFDARDSFGARLNQVAFVERELIIGVHPLDRIDSS